VRRFLVALGIEHFGMTADQLLDMLDADAERTGRSWRDALAELMAHFALKELDWKAHEARRRQQEYLNGSG
jgi:hypothetical protein